MTRVNPYKDYVGVEVPRIYEILEDPKEKFLMLDWLSLFAAGDWWCQGRYYYLPTKQTATLFKLTWGGT